MSVLEALMIISRRAVLAVTITAFSRYFDGIRTTTTYTFHQNLINHGSDFLVNRLAHLLRVKFVSLR